ncbi:MAG: hypothetical protein ACXWIS_24150, partial [Burkholderiales bacterium]
APEHVSARRCAQRRADGVLPAVLCVESLFDGAPGPMDGYVTLRTGAGLGFTPKTAILDLAVD